MKTQEEVQNRINELAKKHGTLCEQFKPLLTSDKVTVDELLSMQKDVDAVYNQLMSLLWVMS
jgi:hypothetical protein